MRSSCMCPQTPQRAMSASAVPKASVVGISPCSPSAAATARWGWRAADRQMEHVLGRSSIVESPPMPGRSLQLLSVVAPMHNEEETVGAFYDRVATALDGLPWELILVDDASTDGTAKLLDDLAERDERVGVLHLSRNFGHQA